MSSEHDGPPPDEVEGDLSDLRDGAPERVDGNRRSAKQRLVWRSAVVVALALVVSTLIYSTRYAVPPTPQAQATPTAVATFLPPTGLGCVRDAAWDPSSTVIALVGPPDLYCGSGGYSPNVVNLYRARTGTLVRQLHPDPAIFAALGRLQLVPVTPTPGGPPQYPPLMDQTLRWSPDGTRLAIRFDVLLGSGSRSQFQVITGLALLAADGRHEQVLVDHQTDAQAAPPAYTVWDLQEGTTMPVGHALAGPPYPPNTLPPARSYTWSGDGSLVPGEPLSVGAPPPPPPLDLVGDPDGGHRFGLWQPGQVTVYAVPVSGQPAPTYLDLFTASFFAAWSPNGRYFVDQLSMNGLLLPSGQALPPRSALSAVQLDQVVGLPIRDAALQQALTHDVPLPVSLALSPPYDVASLAWRPDGNVLAILNPADGFILRASATGRVVKAVTSIQIPPGYPDPFGSLNGMVWSPDGTWLLLPTLALVEVGQLNL